MLRFRAAVVVVAGSGITSEDGRITSGGSPLLLMLMLILPLLLLAPFVPLCVVGGANMLDVVIV
jgi:hypothetical protein